MFNGVWTYETGIEKPEIFGSGSSYYAVHETNDLNEALNECKRCGRNYLLRKKFENRHMVYEHWDAEKEDFICQN